MRSHRSPGPGRSSRPARPSPTRALRLLLLVVPLLTIVSIPLDAQVRQWIDTTLPPYRHPYGIPAGDFLLGAWQYSYIHPIDSVDELWPFFDDLGVNTAIFTAEGWNLEGFQRLVDSPLRPADGRVIAQWPNAGPLPNLTIEASRGIEIIFYPFDSSQIRSLDWPSIFSEERAVDHECVFTQFDDDSVRYNDFYEDTLGNSLREVVYVPSDAGTLACGGIGYNWKPSRVYRYPSLLRNGQWVTLPSDSVLDAGLLTRPSEGVLGYHYYIALTGHLFPNGGAEDTTSLFRIEVVYEVARGEQYLLVENGDTTVATATDNLALPYDTIFVTREDLLPSGSPPNFDRYDTVSIPVDLRWSDHGLGGPAHPQATAHGFDLRVYYLGGESVALRSVSIRDSIGEMMIGDRPESLRYRDSLLEHLRPVLRRDDGSLRQQIIGVYAQDEAPFQQFAGFRELTRLLHQNFVDDNGDSLAAFTAIGYPHLHDFSGMEMLSNETYMNTRFTIIPDWANNNVPGRFHIRYQQIPSIEEHNGGRFTIPNLFSLNDVETLSMDTLRQRVEDYTETFQNLIFGRRTTDVQAWQYQGRFAQANGQLAEFSRRRGLPIISFPGTIRAFSLRVDTTGHLDTLADHQQEPAELRAVVAMDLVYGAKGIIYYGIGGDDYKILDSARQTGEACCMGMPGPTVADTTDDMIDMALVDNFNLSSVTVPGYYVGYRERTRELRTLDAWLQQVGPTLTRLRWRDGYSVHFQEARPDENLADGTPRPIPADEIVTQVTSRRRDDTIPDPPYATYVELGLFDTHRGMNGSVLDSRRDTNYVFVLNRRTFQTPGDLTLSTTAKARLDELSETRVISLKFNLQGLANQYTFIRVRETEPMHDILPGDTAPRHILDTIIGANRSAEVILGPGRATLLEITYMPPDTSFLRSQLEFNNGRRMVFDGKRYHLTFFRQDTVRNPGNLDSLTADNYIYYRRSFPVSETGSIQWEPIDTLPINFDGEANTRFDNRHPSITVHTTSTDTVVTIVWAAESHDPFNSDTNIREICLRNIRVNNFTRTRGPIEWVEDYYQHDMFHPEPTTTFGTPTVESSAGGYAVVWSDAIGGIRAKLRLRPSTPGWWGASGSYSSAVDVSDTFQTAYGFAPGRYPTVPSIGHRASGDSSIAIAWQQPWGGNFSMIYYYRLRQFPSLPGPVPVLGGVPNNYRLNLSTAGGFNTFPSIDGTQDMWWRLQEVVAWESQKTLHDGLKDIFYQDKFLNLRSMYTDPSGRSWRWGEIMYRVAQKVGAFDRPIHASTASLNGLLVPADSLERLYFSVVYQSPDSGAGASMWQGKYWYTREFADDFPQRYLFAGADPNASSATGRQSDRQAVVYETPEQDAVVARTSREFFARQRPSGYRAEGRMIGLSLADTVNTDVEVWLYDPWIATDSTSLPLSLVERDTTYRFTNTLPMAGELLRTGNFHSHDSTQVGLEIYGRYNGSVAAADSGRIMVVAELIDSLDGSVVEQLDSFCISGSSTNYYRQLEPTYDLLSGTYYIRLRIDTANVPDSHLQSNSRYPVVEMRGDVTTEDMGKVRRVRETGGAGYRISAQPNPLGTTTELRFSVAEAGYTTIRIYDALGRPVAEPLSRRWMEPGRFALEIDAGGLANGTYLVELLSDRERVVEKLVVAR